MEGNKLVIAGLDKAGKSTIIQRVFHGLDIDELENHSPTRGIDREEIKLTEDQIQYVFWELGGQGQYRDGHTTKPQIFTQTKLLIFVLDIQDDSRYEAAMQYLQQLIILLRENTFETHVTIILHKFDPTLANELRKKQFVLLKLIKSLQQNFPSVEFSQHSTSIHDDTLFYTFQNIFQRLGLDIGAYKQQTDTNIMLKTRDEEKPSTRAEEIFSQELQKRFATVLESAKTGTSHLAAEMGDKTNIEKLHEIMIKYVTQFHENASYDVKRNAIDAIIISYIEYLADLTLNYIDEGKINEKDAQYILLYVGQINLIKTRVVHYIQRIKISKITEPLKFMETVKQLTNDLLDASYIVGNITLDQLEQMKLLINGVTDSNFSLFRSDSQNVYTFSRIQDLKAAFAQDKFVPANMIIKIELAEMLKKAYLKKLQEQITTKAIEDRSKLDSLETYSMRLQYLFLEFYQIVIEEELQDYDMDRVLASQFHSISLQLLNMGILTNVIGEDERLKIRGILENL